MASLANRPRVDAILEGLGYRLTGPRRKVARLVASKDGAFSAESINDDLPGVGRATVYRTLKLLSEAGILCKTSLPDGASRYSFDDAQHHHHVICTSCGTVGEFRKPALERVLREVANAVDGRVLGHRVELYVTCTDCLGHASPSGDRQATVARMET